MTDAHIFGVDGTPGNRKGVARIRTLFDDRNMVRQVELFGPDGKPTVNDVGGAKTTFEYDARGFQVEVNLFGVDGNPTLGTVGAATERRKYDDRGNLLDEAYFGIDGRPIVARVGYARVDYLYDPRNHQSECTFFGPDGKAMATQLGFARVTTSYDDWGQVFEERYFDPAGREVPVGVTVTQVLPGGFAQRMQFAVGHRLLSYAGRKVTSPKQIADLVLDPWLGDTRILTIARGSQILTFPAPPGRVGVNVKHVLVEVPVEANPQ